MDKPLWIGLLLAGCSAMAAAGDQQIKVMQQASMLVAGTLDIEPDGSVSGYALERTNTLPKAVAELASKTLPQWRFDPVLQEGKPVKARATMRLQFIGNQIDNTHYAVGLGGADFMLTKDSAGEVVSMKQMKAPSYPRDMLDANVTGTVYLALRIDRQGHVTDAIAEQVNLGRQSTPELMAHWRAALAGPTLQTAKGWTFNTPTSGDSANDTSWTVIVPVAYVYSDVQKGDWDVYVPGPKQAIPWSNGKDEQSALETFANGQLH